MVVQPMAGPEDAGPHLVRLAPYAHQVGGHVAVLALDSHTICKPHIEREFQFYQDLPDALHRFVPHFRGVADVVVQHARDGYLNLVACPGRRHPCPPSDGDRRARKDNTDQLICCSPLSTRRPQMCLQRAKPVYRVRLSEGGSLSIDQDSDSDDLFEDLSLEAGYRMFGCNPWSMHCHRQQIAKMWGEQTADQSHKFLLLENVTNQFNHPCILDLKIGLRSYGDDATEAKKKSHIAKIQGTTSSKLGIRVCGMQVYRPDKGRFICRNKYYGRRLTEEGLRQAVAEFVFDGKRSRQNVVAAIMGELTSLRNALSKLDHHRFYGSSLLLIYEGSSEDLHRVAEEGQCSESTTADWNMEPGKTHDQNPTCSSSSSSSSSSWENGSPQKSGPCGEVEEKQLHLPESPSHHERRQAYQKQMHRSVVEQLWNASHHRREDSQSEQGYLNSSRLPSNPDEHLEAQTLRHTSSMQTSSESTGHKRDQYFSESLEDSEEEEPCTCHQTSDERPPAVPYQSKPTSHRGNERQNSSCVVSEASEKEAPSCLETSGNLDEDLTDSVPRFLQNSSHQRRKDSTDRGDSPANLEDEEVSASAVSTARGDSTDRVEQDEIMGSSPDATAPPESDSDGIVRGRPWTGGSKLEALTPSRGASETFSSPLMTDLGDVKRPFESSEQLERTAEQAQKHPRTLDFSSFIEAIPGRGITNKRAEVPSTFRNSQSVDHMKSNSHQPLVHIKMIDFAHAVFGDQSKTKEASHEEHRGTASSGHITGQMSHADGRRSSTTSGHVRGQMSHADGCRGARGSDGAVGGGVCEGPDKDFLYGLRNLLDIFDDIHNTSLRARHDDSCCEDMSSED